MRAIKEFLFVVAVTAGIVVVVTVGMWIAGV